MPRKKGSTTPASAKKKKAEEKKEDLPVKEGGEDEKEEVEQKKVVKKQSKTRKSKEPENDSKETKMEVEEGEEHKRRKTQHGAPTVQEIISDKITHMSLQYWTPVSPDQPNKTQKQYDPQIIEEIYSSEIKGTSFHLQRVMLLELSHYLEK